MDTAGRTPQVLVFIDLVQDIDVLLPILLALRESRRSFSRIFVSRWLQRSHPRTERLLRSCGLEFAWAPRRDILVATAIALRACDAVLTASESSHPAHVPGHVLTRLANERGLATFTVQHGLENIGLLGDRTYGFASRHVFTWHPPELTADLPQATRDKLHHLGRAMLAPPDPGRPDSNRYDVGVFENLHGDSYDDAERHRFSAGLVALAASGARVLLKPHPAGQWSAGQAAVLPANVQLAKPMSALEAIASVGTVITTPSTILLDAALQNRPVALAMAGSSLTAAFPVLDEPQAWPAFARDRDCQSQLRGGFLARVLVPGDASDRIAQVIARVSVGKKL